MEKISDTKCCGGRQQQFKHQSEVLDCDMTFSVFLPPLAETIAVPALYWLSGLTCTDQNFVTKAGAQQFAAEHGIAIICPDTSPRGDGIPDDPEGAWDFGLGAGFYVNATQLPYSTNYQMYDYVTLELPGMINAGFPVDGERVSIAGHSMGGHGALVVALRNTTHFKSVSAFAPIVSPVNCPWGQKAFGRYLGDDKEKWSAYDATLLLKNCTRHLPMLIDQGTADEFLEEQLRTDLLLSAARDADYSIEARMQKGYDHSFFFIASFIGEHVAFHARHLKAD